MTCEICEEEKAPAKNIHVAYGCHLCQHCANFLWREFLLPPMNSIYSLFGAPVDEWLDSYTKFLEDEDRWELDWGASFRSAMHYARLYR